MPWPIGPLYLSLLRMIEDALGLAYCALGCGA
jgi:hypothetical protein